jgi:hypothetical protein
VEPEAVPTWKTAHSPSYCVRNRIPDRLPSRWLPLLPPRFSADKITVEHPSDDLMERYSMSRLTEAEIAPLKEHLLTCRDCRNRGVLMDCDVAAIREALKGWREEKIQ